MTGRVRTRLMETGEVSDGAGPSVGVKRKECMEEDNNESLRYRVITRNRYEPLTDESDTDDSTKILNNLEQSEQKTSHVKKINNNTRKSSVQKIPPIKLHDKHNHKNLTEMIISEIGNNFNIKYTRDSTIINVSTIEQYHKLQAKLQILHINYHTYTVQSTRTLSFVLKGLSSQTEEKDIIACLKEQKIEVVKCVIMKTKYPTFLVSVSQEVNIDELMKIQYVDNTKIYWERYLTDRRITQCHNCQMWGHATSNCFATPKCLKCAASHLTRECPKTRTTPAKCVNCGGEHPANATICRSFLQRQEFLNRNRTERANYQMQQREFPPIRYVPAPLPTSNPWQQRQQQRQQQQQTPATTPAASSRVDQPAAPGGFAELAQEMRKLNQLVDVNKVLQLVRNLNTKLSSATSQRERVQITIEFFINLDD